MSRFFSEKYNTLVPYVPGEQPQDRSYVKLNTNESPFPPSPLAVREAAGAAATLQLYSDPECHLLKEEFRRAYGVEKDRVLFSNGSDLLLNLAFMAFCDGERGAAFPALSYGFYPVFAQISCVPYTEIPLRADFSIAPEDYVGLGKTIVIANPNAPTGLALGVEEIERIVRGNPDNVVVIDEAYVDFGAESCLPLTERYDNLLVIQTFSKSRSMAGARLGFAVGDPALIADLNAVKYSTDPYNVNRMTMAAGVGALRDEAYTRQNCRTIRENRAFTARELKALGFSMTESVTNFLFAAHPAISGGELYRELKARGVLVRYFDRPDTRAYVRITVGTMEQMRILIDTIREILEERT